MRLPLTFVSLLVLASASMTLAWQDFALARDGQTGPRIVVFVGGAVAFLSLALLVRIICRISDSSTVREDH